MAGLGKRLAAEQPDRYITFADRVALHMDEEDRAALIKAAQDPSWSSAKLIDILSKEGITVGRDAFRVWRRSVTG